MTILILGKNGQLSYELHHTVAPLGRVVALGSAELDLSQIKNGQSTHIEKVLEDLRPQIILNAAAYTAVDKAEQEPDLAETINTQAPRLLATFARKHGALLVHYSTDYVFNGTAKKPYTEEDATNPLGVYGKTKEAGEQAIRTSGCRYLIFRTCWLYANRGKNFYLTMRRLAASRPEIRVVNDQIGCPTGARMVAQATALVLSQCLQKGLDASENLFGTYNMAADGSASWAEFAQAILDTMPAAEKMCSTIIPIPSSDYPTPAKRPAYSVLSTEKLQKNFGIAMPTWQDNLRLVSQS